jgi:hypothetical protein
MAQTHKNEMAGKTKRALRLALPEESPRSYEAQMRQLSRQRAKQDKWVKERRQETLDPISDGTLKRTKSRSKMESHTLPCQDD